MSRQVYLLGVSLVLVSVAFLLTNALLWPPGVTEVNARRIRAGMTVEQVELLLGKRDPSGGSVADCRWSGQAGKVIVLLGVDGRVQSAYWCDYGIEGAFMVTPSQPKHSIGDRLRAWLGW